MGEEPPGPFVGSGELLAWFDVSRSRLRVIVSTRGFPEPVQVLMGGAIWSKADVAEWARVHRPQRPAEDDE